MFRVRKASPGDARSIAEVHTTSWKVAYRDIISREALRKLTVEERISRWKNIIENPAEGQVTLVAETGADVVGFITGGPTREPDPDYDGEAYALYVLPTFQKQGVGRKLLQALSRSLARQGLRSLLVWALTDNPAVNFYKKIGGVPVRNRLRTFLGQELPETGLGWEKITDLSGPPAL